MATSIGLRAPQSEGTHSPVTLAPVPYPAAVQPLAPDRDEAHFTMAGDTHDQHRRVHLVRHSTPDGDITAIFDRS